MDYRSINTERQFKDCTSMSKEQFARLCKDIKRHYLEEHGHTYEKYIEEQLVHETPKFQNLDDAIFFVLFQKKNDLVYGALGSVFGMSGSAAHDNYDRFNKLLEGGLAKKKCAPGKGVRVGRGVPKVDRGIGRDIA